MDSAHFLELLIAVRKKSLVDEDSDWFTGSGVYFDALKNELVEVEAEIASGSVCLLEDELGDVLWDYLNYLVALEREGRVSLSNVVERAMNKYSERMAAIDSGVNWKVVKQTQKDRLRVERAEELAAAERST